MRTYLKIPLQYEAQLFQSMCCLQLRFVQIVFIEISLNQDNTESRVPTFVLFIESIFN